MTPDKLVARNIKIAQKTRVFGDLYDGLMEESDFKDIPYLTEEHIRFANLDDSLQPGQGYTFYFTSGTTGKPKCVPYSVSDIEGVAEYLSWFSIVEGLAPASRVLVFMDQFYWGIGHITTQGHIASGNSVASVDSDLSPEAVKGIVDRTKPHVISSLPSLLLKYKEYLASDSVQVLESTGEPLSPSVRAELEASYNARVVDAYGLTEGLVGVECPMQNGFHFNDEKAKVEIIDPVTLKSVPDGMVGELVLTSYDHSILPITRYRTGDLCRVSWEPCQCGVVSGRVWIEGRRTEAVRLFEGFSLDTKELEELLNQTFGINAKVGIEGFAPTRINVHAPNADSALIEQIYEFIKNLNLEVIELVRQRELLVAVNKDGADGHPS